MISSALRESWNEENELKLVSTLNKFKYFTVEYLLRRITSSSGGFDSKF